MRIGVIGTNWGRMHIGGFRQAGADVVALCGQDLEKTQRIAREEGIPLATNRVAELVTAVDVVVVAGPDFLHADHVLEALRHRRAVLCEKPLTRTWQEAQQVLRVAQESGVPCAVSFPYRQLRPLRALKAWLTGRHVSQLVVTVRNGFPPEPQHGDGALLGRSGDFGGTSHVFDAALWLAGSQAQWVQARLGGRPVQSVLAHVGLVSGATVSLSHIPCPEPGIHGSWSLVGDGWEAGFSAGYIPARGGWCLSPVRAFHEGALSTLAPGDGPGPGQLEPWAQAHVETAQLFLAVVSGSPVQGLASFEEGAAVQHLLAAAVESEQRDRRIHLGEAA